VVEQGDPQVEDEALADGGRSPPLHEGQGGLGQCSGYHQEAQHGEAVAVAGHDGSVDDLPEEEGWHHAEE